VEGGRQPAPACISASGLAAYFADVARAQATQALGDRMGATRYVERYVRLGAGQVHHHLEVIDDRALNSAAAQCTSSIMRKAMPVVPGQVRDLQEFLAGA
jgi:hypothetical protein